MLELMSKEGNTFSKKIKNKYKRCIYPRPAPIDGPCASCKERGHRGLVTFPSRDVQWRSAVLLRRILVRASVKERGHHGLVTLLSRDVQWRRR